MKKVLYVILGLVIIYFVLCLFGPSVIKVERSVSVNALPDEVKTHLMDLKFFQEKWSPWSERDPNMKVSYSGEAGKVGYSYSWEGNKEVGKGTLEIVRVTGDSIVEDLMFDGMGTSKAYYITTPEASGSKVIWGIIIDIDFMGRAMMLFMDMDKMMGADFEYGLSKFKKAVEELPRGMAEAKYDVHELDWDAKTFVGKKGTFTFDKLAPFFAENWPKLMADMDKTKIAPLMSPSAIYYKWDEEKGETECSAVMCVPVKTKLPGWEVLDISSSKVFHIEYYGAPDKSVAAHVAMDEYIKLKGFPMQNYVIEEYVTDPTIEKDTAKWLTNIYYIFLNK